MAFLPDVLWLMKATAQGAAPRGFPASAAPESRLFPRAKWTSASLPECAEVPALPAALDVPDPGVSCAQNHREPSTGSPLHGPELLALPGSCGSMGSGRDLSGEPGHTGGGGS